VSSTLFIVHLLPCSRISKLRQRGHSCLLPEYTTDLHKNHFLYDNCTSLSNFNTFGLYLVQSFGCHDSAFMLLCLMFCDYVLCDNVFILMCVCHVLIKYVLTYL